MFIVYSSARNRSAGYYHFFHNWGFSPPEATPFQRLRKSQRSRHGNWSFWQLRFFLSYKARLAGVALHTVDPRNTSCTCHVCTHCEKAKRKSLATFLCKNCGMLMNADWNATINISRATRHAASRGA